MSVLTAASVRKAERNAVKSGIFSFRELMKIAGQKAAEMITENYDVRGKKVAVLCGKGNNGGDGFVCANALKELCEVDVILPFGESETDDAKYYFSCLSGVKILYEMTDNYDIIIDAMFGIGLNRALDDTAKSIIESANAQNAIRIAIDIPSGIQCDTGGILGGSINADLTVTFIALKPCFLLPSSSDNCGKVIVADIGVNVEKYDYLTVEEPILPKRRKNTHKGENGTAIMFCGSYGMCGAAILASLGALRSGVGILKAALSDKIYSPFTAAVPEAVCIPLKTAKSGTAKFSLKKLKGHIVSAKAVLVGCGLGNNKETLKILKATLKTANSPVIIDADGINALSRRISILKEARTQLILTPHPAEMARLCGVTTAEIEANRIYYARKFAAEHSVILVLKGANTIIAYPNGQLYFNTTGNPGMATGGSGDVLSGIILSLIAQGISPEKAARWGVYLHGRAGDIAAEKLGERGLIPSDIAASCSSLIE